jgi:hypothetical protein
MTRTAEPNGPIVSATVVVLSSSVWRVELTAELERLGIDAERAPRAAAKCLGRIVRHAGYRALFDAPDEEQVVEDVETIRMPNLRKARIHQTSGIQEATR